MSCSRCSENRGVKVMRLATPTTILALVIAVASFAPVIIGGIASAVQEARRLYEEIKRWRW
jgi:hypothetical protein